MRRLLGQRTFNYFHEMCISTRASSNVGGQAVLIIARRLACYDYRAVLEDVAEHYGIAADSFLRQRSGAVSRDLVARLARELTPVTLRELSAAFGLTHPDSVRNLIRGADRALLGSRLLRGEIEAIRHRLPKTENRP